MIPGYLSGAIRDRPQGGGYLWRGLPWLGEVNEQIAAQRDAPSREMAEAERQQQLRVRDVPATCICDWAWSARCDRWVRPKGRRRQGCPVHRQRGGGAA